MDIAAPKDHSILRRLKIPGLIQRNPTIFRLVSYLRAEEARQQNLFYQGYNFIQSLWRERTISEEMFIYTPEVPRFIGGVTGRSGTTWLERIFRYSFSGEIETIGERHFFWLYGFRNAPQEYSARRRENQDTALKSFRELVLGPGFNIRWENKKITYGGLARLIPKRALKISLDALETSLLRVRKNEEVRRCFGEFYLWLLNYWSACVSGQKKAWISKEPDYGPSCGKLFALVPNARLVVLARDGRDVALSFQRAGWDQDIGSAMLRWQKFVHATLENLSSLPADQWFLVRYEDLNYKFEEILEQITSFLKLDIELSQINIWPRPAKNRVRNWEKELSADQVSFFEKECGGIMERLGYD